MKKILTGFITYPFIIIVLGPAFFTGLFVRTLINGFQLGYELAKRTPQEVSIDE